MDTSSFFDYPTLPAQPAAAPRADLLPGRAEEDWAVLLGYCETRRVHPGDWLIREGERERALYLLADGRLEVHAAGRAGAAIAAPATVGEVGFLDGLPAAAGVRALAHGEAQRLSFEAFESLSAREPRLARELLLDVGRLVAAELRRLWAGGSR